MITTTYDNDAVQLNEATQSMFNTRFHNLTTTRAIKIITISCAHFLHIKTYLEI